MKFEKIEKREKEPLKQKTSIFKEYLKKSEKLNKAEVESIKSFEKLSLRD